MKKFIIAMLCVAVLFGFAACDNSNDTPVNPDDDQQVAGGLSDRYIGYYAEVIGDLLTGNTEAFDNSTVSASKATTLADVGAKAILASDTNTTGELLDSTKDYAPIKNVTIADDYTSVSMVVDSLKDGTEGFASDTVVTLTLKGVDTTPNATKSEDKVINLEKYVYEFTTPVYNPSGDVTTLSGTISGYVTDGVFTVERDANGKATSAKITTDISDVILPQSAADFKVTLGENETVSAERLASVLNGAEWSTSGVASYAGYRENLIGKDATAGYQKNIADYVAVLTTSATDVFNILKTEDTGLLATKPEGFTTDYQGTKAEGGVATITYTVPADETAVLIAGEVGEGKKNLKLAEGDTLKITLKSAANVEAVESFVADTFEITGTFQAYTNTTAESAFDEIYDVAISGKISGVTVTNSNDTVGGLTITTVAASQITGSAKADIAVGPALQQSGDDVGELVVEAVTAEIK